MKNKIVSIGWLGNKECYLNIDRQEAIRRYLLLHPQYTDIIGTDEGPDIEEFEFDDTFSAYHVYA